MKKTERLGLRLTPEQKKSWEAAAARNGMPVSKWLAMWADFAANFQPPK